MTDLSRSSLVATVKWYWTCTAQRGDCCSGRNKTAELEYCLQHSLAVLTWLSCLTSVNLSFLNCKMEMITAPCCIMNSALATLIYRRISSIQGSNSWITISLFWPTASMSQLTSVRVTGEPAKLTSAPCFTLSLGNPSGPQFSRPSFVPGHSLCSFQGSQLSL